MFDKDTSQETHFGSTTRKVVFAAPDVDGGHLIRSLLEAGEKLGWSRAMIGGLGGERGLTLAHIAAPASFAPVRPRVGQSQSLAVKIVRERLPGNTLLGISPEEKPRLHQRDQRPGEMQKR